MQSQKTASKKSRGFSRNLWISTKKGEKSVGVARQYLGSVGKVDNGQVGVFTALCKDSQVALLHGRIYLPEEWVKEKLAATPSRFPKMKGVRGCRWGRGPRLLRDYEWVRGGNTWYSFAGNADLTKRANHRLQISTYYGGKGRVCLDKFTMVMRNPPR